MKKCDIAAYIWPSYTGKEPRSRIFWDEGIGEWQTVRKAGGPQPVWGYEDEADPRVMERQIDAAVSHGVNVFIYDWYWYDRRPFLECCLNDGFLGASNRSRMKFYLMWANHDADMTWDRRNSFMDTVIWEGSQPPEQFKTVVNRVITRYFSQPEYYKIDGKPVFMIYDVENLIMGLGGLESTRRWLDWFREETVKAGFPGLELQMTFWSERALNVSGVDGNRTGSPYEVIEALDFDSITHYQFVHFTPLYHSRPYSEALELYKEELRKIDGNGLVCYTHVSIGWDNNPRFINGNLAVITDNPPSEFRKGLELAWEYLEKHPERQKLITVNSWNEWTESSELLPNDVYGFGYLEAIKEFIEE